jgi:hypothetical protein
MDLETWKAMRESQKKQMQEYSELIAVYTQRNN